LSRPRSMLNRHFQGTSSVTDRPRGLQRRCYASQEPNGTYIPDLPHCMLPNLYMSVWDSFST
ncbi:MAG: hypothetical protein VX815_00610, partial [Gemmatimonadota bacterium]|nr:hypothetical protein [Gemmatimonadota bacterium]